MNIKLLFALLILSLAAGPASPAILAGQYEWTATSGPPGPIYAVAVDPSGPNTMYAATGAAGVFKSTDGGKQWTRASQGLGSNAVLSIAIDPSQTSTILAGTNRGIFRTDDAAATWTGSSTGIARDFFGFAFIYTMVPAGGSAGTFYAGTLRGVFKSVDGGRTWQGKNSGLQLGTLPAVEAVALDPADTNVVYAGASYAGLGGTIFKSRDGGDTWAPLTTDLASAQVSSLAIDPADHTVVYAATRGQGLIVSRDEGRTWRAAGVDAFETDLAAVVVSGSPRAIFVAGMRKAFYRSSDNGQTWEETNNAMAKRGPRSLTLDNRNGNGVWLATAGGLYHSSSQGSEWSESGRGLTASEIVHVVAYPLDSRLAYVSSWAGGIYRTVDGGASWNAASPGVGIVGSLAVDPENPLLVYAGMIFISGIMETGLYFSRDGGNAWDLVPAFKERIVSAITTLPGKVYVGTDVGVHISSDAGVTWSQSNSGLPDSRQVLAISTHPIERAMLFSMIESLPQTLFRSSDGGQAWSQAYTFPQPLVTVVPSPAAAGLVYAAIDDSVFQSIDGGMTWTETPFGPGRGTILAVRPHPVAPNTVYLGSTRGVYRSVDRGNSWTLLGLEDESVTDIAISDADPTIVYGGTFGSGVWSYSAPPSLSASPATLKFLAEPEGMPPPATSLVVTDPSGGTFGWSVETPPWLSITPTSSLTLPATLTVGLNTSGLAAGHYENSVTISPTVTGTQATRLSVPATLHLAPIKRWFLPIIIQGTPTW